MGIYYIVNWAAYEPVERLERNLLSAYVCEPKIGCVPKEEIRKAAHEISGRDVPYYNVLFWRNILVKHRDGSLEMAPVYFARTPSGTTELIDATGKSCGSDLESFRQRNEQFSSDDWILVQRDITTVPGEGEMVTVSGHTAADSRPWVIGGAAIVKLLAAAIFVLRRSKRVPASPPIA